MAVMIHLQPRARRPSTAELHAVETLRSRLEPYAAHLRRLAVRFDKSVNTSGNVDEVCRVHVTLGGVLESPSFVIEGRAPQARQAVELATDAVAGAVGRAVEDAERRRGRKRVEAAREVSTLEVKLHPSAAESESDEEASLRRQKRDVTPRTVRTAHPLRGRHIHKTASQARATAAREASDTRPSRKSTRKSANRSKRDANQVLRNERAARSPTARAERGH